MIRKLFPLCLMALMPTQIWADDTALTDLTTATSAEQTAEQTDANLMNSHALKSEMTVEEMLAAKPLTLQAPLTNGLLSADSLLDDDEIAIDDDKPATRSLLRSVTAGVPLVVGGLIAMPQKKSYRALRNDFLPQFRNHTDDYTQYLPAAVMLGMKAAGVKGRSSWGRMLVSDALSAATMAAVVNAVKYSTHSLRPDTTDHRSFPSGHTATAFMTATMLVKEYGHLSPWVSVGAYTVAAGTGLMRMANNKHWVSDVMVGAGIGIISTEFGYWLADVIMKDKGLNKSAAKRGDNIIDMYRRPSFFSINVGLNVPLSDYPMCLNMDDLGYEGLGNLDLGSYKLNAAALLGLEGAYFFSPYVGVGGRLSVVDVKIDGIEETTEDEGDIIDITGCSSAYYTLHAGPYFNLPLSARWSIGSKLLFGAVFYPKMTVFATVNDETADITFRGSQGFSFGTGVNLNYQIEKNLMASLFANYDVQACNSAITNRYLHALCFGVKAGISF